MTAHRVCELIDAIDEQLPGIALHQRARSAQGALRVVQTIGPGRTPDAVAEPVRLPDSLAGARCEDR